MLHGWMDVSASFQFVADALGPEWHVIAPDWRGFGLSHARTATATGFPTTWPISIICLTASLPDRCHRPQHGRQYRVAVRRRAAAACALRRESRRSRLYASHPEQAPARYAQWLDELKAGGSMRDYATVTEVAARLRRNNPRLTAARAKYLAAHWAQPCADGRWAVAGDPAHKIINPTLYRLDEVLACWKQIACPVLWVRAAQTDVLRYVRGNRPRRSRRSRRRGFIAVPGARHRRCRPHGASRPAGGSCTCDRGFPVADAAMAIGPGKMHQWNTRSTGRAAADLHSHSIISDGTLTPAKLVARARPRRRTVFADRSRRMSRSRRGGRDGARSRPAFRARS